MTEMVEKAGKHPGKTPAQRKVLDMIGCGERTPPMSRKTREALLREGLIEVCGRRCLGQDALGPIEIEEYQMPIPVHMAWCEAMAAQRDTTMLRKALEG